MTMKSTKVIGGGEKPSKRFSYLNQDHQSLLHEISRQDSIRSGLSRDDSTPVLWKQRSSRRPSMKVGSDRSILSNTASQVSFRGGMNNSSSGAADDGSLVDGGSLIGPGMLTSERQSSRRLMYSQQPTRIFDDADVMEAYRSVPIIEIDRLPRGGISFDTKAVGRIQFGIPPETIKDSMVLGLGVPSVYIVPVERFCREMGPALGINLCEFEFPAYFNYFVRVKRCTLIVDSLEDEKNIRRVFGETLIGPEIFRNHDKPTPNCDEDFDSNYPVDARPNFYKEFYHFRTAEESNNYQEMTIDTIIEFRHFGEGRGEQGGYGLNQKQQQLAHKKLGIPPMPEEPVDEMAICTSNFYQSMDMERSLNKFNLTSETSRRMLAPSENSKYNVNNTNTVKEDRSFEDDDCSALRRTYSDPDLEHLLRPGKNYDNLMKKDPEKDDDSGSFLLRGKSSKKKASSKRLNSNGTFTGGDDDSKMGDGFWGSAASVNDSENGDKRKDDWTYSQAKWLGVVATVYPTEATEDDKATTMTARCEIFKMPGGLEYIVHDINDQNEIIGRVRFSGTVHIPDFIAVNGFTSSDVADGAEGMVETDEDGNPVVTIPRQIAPPTFHPPSFGVTVLGNSHGFDKSGSTSGYVLWINGRGVMIDPPPYSSATLEKEGIRPQMIMAIVVTHCHADHDSGAFQKVMTGSRVAVITTPTIYNSFIRKYAALSGLSPALLRHSHRHRPAIIGQPLLFQGASFHFTYTLHTIPCIAFRVEWRGRSIVFTGDHLNSPPMLDTLEGKGVLTKARADSLRNMPLQDCDVLLHESGAPPIHTPLKVLLELPEHVKKRMYVVHTSALPEGCELRIAPTGTAGTIRLDQPADEGPATCLRCFNAAEDSMDLGGDSSLIRRRGSDDENQVHSSFYRLRDSYGNSRMGSARFHNPFKINEADTPLAKSFRKFAKRLGPKNQNNSRGELQSESHEEDGGDDISEENDEKGAEGEVDTYGWTKRRQSQATTAATGKDRGSSFSSQGTANGGKGGTPPLVHLRPTCVSDAWFILNLLSNVPFLSSLSYDKTMEVLETAIVKVFCAEEIIVPADRRSDTLCVVWEGTCMEKPRSSDYTNIDNANSGSSTQRLSLVSDGIVAEEQDEGEEGMMMSEAEEEAPSVWHAGDWTGPLSLQPDPSLSGDFIVRSMVGKRDIVAVSPQGVKVIIVYMKDLHEILKFGSSLYRKYLDNRENEQNEKRKANNKQCSSNNDDNNSPLCNSKRLNANLIKQVSFSTQIMGKHSKMLSKVNFLEIVNFNSAFRSLTASQKRHLESLVDGPRYFDPGSTMWGVGTNVESAYLLVGGSAKFAVNKMPNLREKMMRRMSTGSMDVSGNSQSPPPPPPTNNHHNPHNKNRSPQPQDTHTGPHDTLLFNVHPKSEYRRLEVHLQLRLEQCESGTFEQFKDLFPKEQQLRDSKDRFANKVLARLYARRAYTAGLVFSRGHFLSDTTRMVSGSLAFMEGKTKKNNNNMSNNRRGSLVPGDIHVHRSTLIAGSGGCLVMEFPRNNLIQFLDAYPGVLLSLLGTQVVV